MDHYHNENDDPEVVTLSDDDDSYFEMEAVKDVRMERGKLEYRIVWVETDVETWEPESNFLGEESMRVLARFKEEHKEEIEQLMLENEERKKERRKSRERSRSREEGTLSAGSAAGSSSSLLNDSGFSARELTEDDNFYGKPVKELQGESKRLFDPNHMQTPTDLLLATYVDSDGRMSRSKAAKLKQEISGSASGSERGETPTIPKISTTGRGRGGRGRGRGSKLSAEKTPSPNVDMANMNNEDDEGESGSSTKKKPRKSAAKTTPKRGRGGGRGRGRGRRLVVTDVFDDEKSDSDNNEDNSNKSKESNESEPKKSPEPEPEPMDESPPPVRKSRKRVAKEPSPMIVDDDRRSETPETSKPKFFIDRDDEEESAIMWPKKLQPNSGDPVAEITSLFDNLESNRRVRNDENIIKAILSGDVLSARLIFNKMSSTDIDNIVTRYVGTDGRPILHVLINRMKPGLPGKASNAMTMMRLVLSFTRQFIFFISDSQGNMAIHEAVKTRNFRVVRLLANSYSLLVQRNNDGDTPLMLAMKNKDLKIFQFLLNRGVTYHQLLARAESKEKTLLKEAPNFTEVLNKTVQQQNKELTRMRKRLLRSNIKDLQPSSPILIIPRHESNSLNFTFECIAKLDHANQGHLLMMFPIVYHNTLRRWVASLNNIPIEKDQPLLNGLSVSKVQNKTHSSVFLCVPKNGMNQLVIPLLNDSWNSCAAVAVQIVKYEKSNGQGPSSSHIPPPLPQQHHYQRSHNPNMNQGPSSSLNPNPNQNNQQRNNNPHNRPHQRRF